MLFSALHYSTWSQEGVQDWLQLVHCANYLVLVFQVFQVHSGDSKDSGSVRSVQNLEVKSRT